MGKEVATTKGATGTAVATGGYDYGENSGVGFEGTTRDDLSIPFLNILQSNSPEVEEKLIDGAESGMIFNTVTKELVKEGVVFQPVETVESWVEWKPRIQGGGFVKIHEPTSDVVVNLLRENGGSRIPPVGPDGKRVPFKVGQNELVETYYVYGLLLGEDGLEVNGFGVISFNSTKIKPYRDWKTSMYLLKGKPPLFANRARITTVRQKNDAGSYYNFTIRPFNGTWAESLLDPSTTTFKEGVAFYEMVKAGDASADFKNEKAGAGTGEQRDSGPEGAGGGTDDDDVPF